MASNKIASGVFAVNKPLSKSSAQVIRDLQEHFRSSRLFQPWLTREQARLDAESDKQRRRKRKRHHMQPLQVKMGHGGTLDPEATGVLILGVGDGTKSLNNFLSGTKSYECIVLFGVSTDSYDGVGKVVDQKPFAHITRDKVEEALGQFRGDIMQKPPIYSALRINGKRLYEIAREGGEMPAEIKERPMKVDNMEMLEWYDGATHAYTWPAQSVDKEDKEIIDKLTTAGGEAQAIASNQDDAETAIENSSKRKRDTDVIDGTEADKDDVSSPKRPRSSTEPAASGALKDTLLKPDDVPEPTIEQTIPAINQDATMKSSNSTPCAAPACRIRMTVSSGFYVRSFCHDLGIALGSAAFMAALVRTRQHDFELGKNVVEIDEFAKGEDVWGPKVESMLDDWNARQGPNEGSISEQPKRYDNRASNGGSRKNRNSSSPESGG